MAQIKNKCLHTCCSTNGYQNRRMPSLFTITSYSQAPSLSDEFSEEDQQTLDSFKRVTQPFDVNNKRPSKSAHCKGLMCKSLSQENDKHQRSKNSSSFSSKSLNDQPATKATPSECPIHSKTNCKSMDINKLEESYWAHWKPSKCSEMRSDNPTIPDLPTKMCRMTSGSAKCTMEVPKMPVPNVNLGNYVQCKTCLKFIEKNPQANESCLHGNYSPIDNNDTSDVESGKNNEFQEDDEYTTYFESYSSEYSDTDCRIIHSETFSNDVSHTCKCKSLKNSDSTYAERGSIISDKSLNKCERHSQKSKETIQSTRTKYNENNSDTLNKEDARGSNYREQLLYNNEDYTSDQSTPNTSSNQTDLNHEYTNHYQSDVSLKHVHNRDDDNDLLYDPHKQAYSESHNTDDTKNGQYEEKIEYNKQSGNKTPNEYDGENRSRTPTKYEQSNRSKSGTPNRYSSGNKTPRSIISKEDLNANHNRVDQEKQVDQMPKLDSERKPNQVDPINYSPEMNNLLNKESKPSYIYSINSGTTPRILKGHSYPLKPVMKKEKRSTSTSRPISKNMYKFKK